jgi:hypothetical protein
MTQCNLVNGYQHFGWIFCLYLQATRVLYPEDGCSMFLRNVGNYTTSHLLSALYLLGSVYVKMNPSVSNEMPIDCSKSQMLTFKSGLKILKFEVPARLAQWQRVRLAFWMRRFRLSVAIFLILSVLTNKITTTSLKFKLPRHHIIWRRINCKFGMTSLHISKEWNIIDYPESGSFIVFCSPSFQ